MANNPNFNDPRNIRRDRKGLSRLEAHEDDAAQSDELSAQRVDDLQAQHDAEIIAVEPLEDDETRADIRERFLSIPENTEEDDQGGRSR